MTSRPRLRALGACVLAAALSGACGGGGTSSSAPAAYVRLAPHPAGGPGRAAGAVPEPAVVARFVPAAEPDAWEWDAPEAEVVGGVARLGAPEPGTWIRAVRRGSYGRLAFDRVRVIGACRGEGSLQVLLRHGEEVLGRSRSANPIPSAADEPRATMLELSLGLAPGTELDALELSFSPSIRAFELHSVELLAAPPESLFPRAEDGGGLVFLGREARRGVALASGRPLELRFEAPETAAELELSIGTPPGPPGVQRGLDVLLRGAQGGRRTEHFALDTERAAGTTRWRRVALSLEGFEGEDVFASLELETLVDGTATAGVVVVAESALRVAGTVPPRVVLVTTDTHRGDHLGLAAHPAGVATPSLDALALRGVFFERCLSSINTTNPSHAALMTGRHPRDVGVLDNRHRLGEAAATLAERFAAAGYATWAAVSSPHVLDYQSGLGQGFDRMVGPGMGPWTARETVDEVLRWADEGPPRPLFLWVHVYDAHWPYDPPVTLGRRYEARETEHAEDESELPPHVVEAGGPRLLRAHYKAEVAFLDQELGRLIEGVAPPGGGAILAFVGDHGEMMGESGGIWFDHGGLYPGSLHVPLILVWPDAPAGARVAARVEQIDVGRTLLDLAGLDAAPFPGHDLRATLAPEGEAPAETPHFALHDSGLAASLTSGGYHLILQLADSPPTVVTYGKKRHEVELYDLRADPLCGVDLVDAEPERAKAMRRALIVWLRAAERLGWGARADTGEAMEERLEELGYAEVEGPGGELWVEDDCENCRRFQ